MSRWGRTRWHTALMSRRIASGFWWSKWTGAGCPAALCRWTVARKDEPWGHDTRERIGGTVPRLSIRDLKPFVLPVNIVQRELGNFTGPQSVGHQHQEDGVVSTPTRRSSVNHLQHSAYLSPSD